MYSYVIRRTSLSAVRSTR